MQLRSWLAPGIPAEVFEWMAEVLTAGLGRRVQLQLDDRGSGPLPGEPDPFAAGEVDIGVVCAPTLARLGRGPHASVTLVPAAFDFGDPLAGPEGRPVYYSLVCSRGPDLAALRGARAGFNDPVSLSGFHALKARVGDGYFGEWVRTGGHLASLRLLAEGAIDVAAIDSNTWRWTGPHPGIEVIERLGPFPIQPVVARRGVDVRAVADVLLRSSGPYVTRFVPVSMAAYDSVR